MAPFRDVNVVFCDIGGTLLDFLQPESMAQFREGAAAAHAYLQKLGRPVPSVGAYHRALRWRLLLAYLGARLCRRELASMPQLAAVHRRLGLPLEEDELHEVSRRLYAPTHLLAHAYPTTVGALRELQRRGFRLGLISNTIAPPPGLDAHLAAEGLLDLFPVRIYSCVVGVAKPHPEIFAAALKALPGAPQRAIYVGDKPRIDVLGARRVGMRTVLRVPPDRPRPKGPAADAEIRQIADLLDLLPASAAP
jgi:putative hydrolase of the HAD superfamily